MRNGNKSNEPRKSGGSLLAGILLGMILGLIAAAGVAWYILKNGSASFEDKEHRSAPKTTPEVAPAKPIAAPATVAPVAPAVSAPAATSAVSPAPQHYEFYKELTDKPDNATSKPAATAKHPATAEAPCYIQAGSFSNKSDAEAMKAQLTMADMKVSLQEAVISGKGTYYRVQVGPFKGTNEVSAAMATLKQNGVPNPSACKKP